MHKSPGFASGRFSSLCRQFLPQLCLVMLIYLIAFESPAAAAAPGAGPLLAQRARSRPWSLTTKIEIGLGAFVIILIAAVVYHKHKGEKEVVVTAPSDIIGGSSRQQTHTNLRTQHRSVSCVLSRHPHPLTA